jgi:hypothetical protein
MPLEAESANRVGRGASARLGAESSSTLKNSARFVHPVSKNQVKVEACDGVCIIKDLTLITDRLR